MRQRLSRKARRCVTTQFGAPRSRLARAKAHSLRGTVDLRSTAAMAGGLFQSDALSRSE